MPETVSIELPLLVIVSVRVAVVSVTTFPNAKLPPNPMFRFGAMIPVPEALVVFTPLVASLFTVTVPL
jgi:hypothetical protein